MKDRTVLHPFRALGAVMMIVSACSTSATDDAAGGGGSGSGAGEGGATSGAGGDAGIGGSGGAAEGGPIAPGCTEELDWCAEGEASALLACETVDGDDFQITMEVAGEQLGVACLVEEEGNLGLTIEPLEDSPAYGSHWMQFRLLGYTGEGTYDLEGSEDGEIAGLTIQGETIGTTEALATASSLGGCSPSRCRAIVAPGSEPIPTDPDAVHEFRLRLEIECDAEGTLWQHPDCESTDRCTYVTPPSARVDVQCSN